MRIVLREPVSVSGEMQRQRYVEGDAIDWARRVVWLPDGRWVPFENILIGAPEQKLSDHPPAPRTGVLKIRGATAALNEAHVCGCKRVFPTVQALGAHQRFCKGEPA